jgi:hypothetical protein
MNRKQFAILLVLVAVIGGAGLIIHQRGSQSWQGADQSAGQKLLPNLSVNDVAKITIQSGTNNLNLARQNNLWCVLERGGYPANFQQISDLLLKLADLKIVESDDVGPSQLGRYNLLPPGTDTNTATVITFSDANGKALASLLLGKKHMKKPSGGGDDTGWPDGRYVMVGGNTGGGAVDLISDSLDAVDPNPATWLNKDFFSIEKPGSISVQYPVATNSWALTRVSETNDWQLANANPGERLDSSKVSGVTSPFSSASFNDVLPASTDPATAGLTNPTTISVKTLDGLSYTATIGSKQNGNYPLTLAVTADAAPKANTNALAKAQTFAHWIYQVPDYAVDPLLVPRSQLLEVQTNSSPAK